MRSGSEKVRFGELKISTETGRSLNIHHDSEFLVNRLVISISRRISVMSFTNQPRVEK